MLTVRIATTDGQSILIDADDYERVSPYSWSAFRPKTVTYASAWIGRRKVSLHRFIMGEPDGFEVDHKNCDGLDNRKSNLRIATVAQNRRNARLRSDSTSGYKGVCYDKSRGLWMATITINRKWHNLGRYASKEDAARAYNARASEAFGEFARLNPID